MQNSQQRIDAEQAYQRGAALVQDGRYPEAIFELRRAEDLFRRLDAVGHPFNLTLENGISGLANVLYLLGRCYRQQGDITAAIATLETSTINERFERTIPFRSFRRMVEEDLAFCYEQVLSREGTAAGSALPHPDVDPPIDLSYRFPFSLPPDSIPPARLYEIAPKRFQQYQAFYEQARMKDVALRRAGSKADDSTMRTISIGVWSVLVAIWLAYGIVVIRNVVYP